MFRFDQSRNRSAAEGTPVGKADPRRTTGIIVGLALFLSVSAAAPVLAAEGTEKPSLFTGDLGNILWSLLTFGAVLFVLGKFAWRPILGALQKREEFIRNSLEEAKRNREESEARLREYSEKVGAARAEATAIVEEGRRDAEVLRRRMEDAAKRESAAMIERARREIAIATDTAVKELYTLSAKLATEVAARVIESELDHQRHERLIRESIEELGRSHRRETAELQTAGRR